MVTIQEEEAGRSGVIVLEPTGIKLGATGISSAYDDRYPPVLEGWITSEEWFECIGRINMALMDRFPCGMCRLQAYCCCPCTLGLSLLSIRRQANEIERGVGEVIDLVNQNLEARRRGVRFGFRRRYCRAWVQVEYGSLRLLPAEGAAASPLAMPSATTGNEQDSGTDGGREKERYGMDEGGRPAKIRTVAAMSGSTQDLRGALLERGGIAGERASFGGC